MRTCRTILESADHALFKMVRYVLLRPLRPELDAKTKKCLPAKTRFCLIDEQAISLFACPDRKVDVYLICLFELKFGISLGPKVAVVRESH
jgi:hypothetical protein